MAAGIASGALVSPRDAGFIATRIFDLIIAVSYFLIPVTLLYFLSREAVQLVFPGAENDRKLCRHVAVCIASFILVCGVSHAYRFTVVFAFNQSVGVAILALCAVISAYTAALLIWKTPRILSIMAKVEIAQKGNTTDLSKAFDLVVELVPDMLSVHDKTTLSFLHSNALCSVYGYSSAALMKRPLSDIVHAEDHPVLEGMLADCVVNRVSAYMFRIVTANGACITVESIPKMGRWKNRDAVFLLTRNVQSRIENFDRAVQVKQEQARVDANKDHAMTLAHDLRTSLSIFELAMGEIKLQPGVDAEAVASANSAVWFMKFIVERTVECCRVLQGEKPKPFLEVVDIREVLKSVVDMLQVYPKSIAVVCKLEVQKSSFLCDREWLESIVASLLCNACDNTMYGSVQVLVTGDTRIMNIEVRDTGVGIPEHDVQRLFCPFSKLGNKLKPEHGLGIGLYNCAWRIRHLGGTYGYRSNDPHGSVFHFSLPFKTIETHKAELGTADDMINSGRQASGLRRPSFSNTLFDNLKVLIVDDAVLIRKLLSLQLAKRGIVHIDEAEDGTEALEMLKTTHYDIALVDNMMPIMNGTECIRKYKDWESVEKRFPPTTFLMMSADVLKSDTDILSNGYVMEFFKKPVPMMRLMTVLRDLVTA
jgi:PAS domain S-box-containing protein